MKRRLLYHCAFGALLAWGGAGCSSTRDWNPFVELGAYEVVVVEDFEDDGLGFGESLADQLASELMRRGKFKEVLRERVGSESIVLSGTIQDYSEGNVAARIKFGRGVGEAKLAIDMRVAVDPGDEFVGNIPLRESTVLTGPDARRTGREDADWLRQHVVEKIADTLMGRM